MIDPEGRVPVSCDKAVWRSASTSASTVLFVISDYLLTSHIDSGKSRIRDGLDFTHIQTCDLSVLYAPSSPSRRIVEIVIGVRYVCHRGASGVDVCGGR
jgi:hypothetical protein